MSVEDIYDTKNCPRDDGGRLRDEGLIDDGPYRGGEQRFFSCPHCGKFWTVIELKRRQPSAGFQAKFRKPEAKP